MDMKSKWPFVIGAITVASFAVAMAMRAESESTGIRAAIAAAAFLVLFWGIRLARQSKKS